jgi:hypothetical protein
MRAESKPSKQMVALPSGRQYQYEMKQSIGNPVCKIPSSQAFIIKKKT